MQPLILASSSPRRSLILEKAGYAFHTLSVELSENIDKNMSLDDALLALSRQKARAVYQAYVDTIPKNAILLSADTSVVLGGNILGKPKDQEEAKRYLKLLSGRSHKVKTAFCLQNLQTSEIINEVCNSTVFFKSLSEQDIAKYIATDEPYDKAGGYGIQGKGRELVDHYEGSFYNIMGLPIERLEEVFSQPNWQITKRV